MESRGDGSQVSVHLLAEHGGSSLPRCSLEVPQQGPEAKGASARDQWHLCPACQGSSRKIRWRQETLRASCCSPLSPPSLPEAKGQVRVAQGQQLCRKKLPAPGRVLATSRSLGRLAGEGEGRQQGNEPSYSSFPRGCSPPPPPQDVTRNGPESPSGMFSNT